MSKADEMADAAVVLSATPLRVVVLIGPSKDFWWELSVIWRKDDSGPWDQRQIRLSHDEAVDLARHVK